MGSKRMSSNHRVNISKISNPINFNIIKYCRVIVREKSSSTGIFCVLVFLPSLELHFISNVSYNFDGIRSVHITWKDLSSILGTDPDVDISIPLQKLASVWKFELSAIHSRIIHLSNLRISYKIPQLQSKSSIHS